MSFKRVLFVFPETRYPSGQPPLGIASLSAVLKRAGGHETALCDMSFDRRPFETLAGILSDFRPDLVGVSMMTPQIEAGLRTAGIVRRYAPGAYLVFGGPHPTVQAEDTLERTGADLVCSGEADRSFLMIASGADPAGVPGSCFRSGGVTRRIEGLLLTDDLDELPLPDRSLFDMERYFRTWYSMDRVDTGLRGTSVMATRGCPFGCTFCQPTLSEIFGRKIRKRSPSRIIDEIESLVRDYAISAFMFEDSTFILDHGWVHMICDGLVERRLGLKWCCNVRADLLDADLLSHMKAAGLAKINMGVESASQRVLDDIYNKGITVGGVERALRLAKGMGIRVQGYFMLGAPGETREEMEQTIAFAARLPFDDALFDITTPFPHTELWNRTRSLINRDYTDFDCFQRCVYDLGDISAREIERMKRRAFWRFYLHPSRVLRTAATALGPRRLVRTLAKARRV
jgi:anaerobic magnesium-protoporphyrin IX monomethyl ester cyclase